MKYCSRREISSDGKYFLDFSRGQFEDCRLSGTPGAYEGLPGKGVDPPGVKPLALFLDFLDKLVFWAVEIIGPYGSVDWWN